MTEKVHIIGAGLAGISAAVHLISQGKAVSLYESTSQAGGRCRSYQDDVLNRTLDNGNHLVLSGNVALQEYLSLIGAEGVLEGPETARFDFYDHKTRERWCIDFGKGRIPWSLFNVRHRVPNSALIDYLAPLKLFRAGRGVSVEACLGQNKNLYERLWHPLATAILNTNPKEAQGASLWPVFKQAFASGGKSCRPLIARAGQNMEYGGLSAAFINPAIEWLSEQGAEINFNHRLTFVEREGQQLTTLKFMQKDIEVKASEKVIIALPPWVTSDLIKLKKCPNQHRPIINGHFELPFKLGKLTVIGLTNAVSDWVFAKGDIASVTISAAGDYMGFSNESMAEKIWPEILACLGLEASPLGKFRIIREKRATIAQTSEQVALRPTCHESGLNNTLLAGDWTATGLPATIEGAILSGKIAAKAIMAA